MRDDPEIEYTEEELRQRERLWPVTVFVCAFMFAMALVALAWLVTLVRSLL